MFLFSLIIMMKYNMGEKSSRLYSKRVTYHKIINVQEEILKILNFSNISFQRFSQFVYKLWKTHKNTS